jgi:hypothetical protein
VPTVLKSGSLSLLEPPEPVQACHGIALPLRLPLRLPLPLHLPYSKLEVKFLSPHLIQ